MSNALMEPIFISQCRFYGVEILQPMILVVESVLHYIPLHQIDLCGHLRESSAYELVARNLLR